jgi:hypothetical protein
MQLELPQQVFEKKKKQLKYLKYQMSRKSVQNEPSCCMWTDGRANEANSSNYKGKVYPRIDHEGPEGE